MPNTTCKMKKLTLQLYAALSLCIAGIVLLFMGFWCAPVGIIDNSVLVAFGEASTFSGALFGVDYSYRYKYFIREKNKEEDENN